MSEFSNITELFVWLESLSDDECKAFFRKEIVRILDIEEYDITYILDDIKTSCEYTAVFFSLNTNIMFGTKEKLSTYAMQRSDISKKIETAKNRIISDLKYLYKNSTLKYDGTLIQSLSDDMQDIEIDEHQYTKSHKETAIKSAKENLYNELISNCDTGIKRAKDITQIYKYL